MIGLRSKKFKISFFSCLLVLIVPSVVVAQSAVPPVQPQIIPNADNDVSAQADRVKERKAKTQKRFSFVEQKLIKQKCQNAQKETIDSPKVNNFVQRRTQSHEQLVAKLEKLSSNMKASGVDTTRYDEQVSVLKQKVNEYVAELFASRQAFFDLKSMSCTTDPEGFAATLLEARKLRLSFIEKGKEIRLYLKDTIKPTLKEMRSQLRANNQNKETLQ